MKLVIAGLDSPVRIEPGCATVLEVENSGLFARIARSLQSGMGADSLEPYTLWEEGGAELNPKNSLLFVSDPLNLPWDNKSLIGEVMKRIEAEYLADEDLRQQVELAEQSLAASLFSLSMGLDSTYSFGIDWDFKRYLSMLGFRAKVQIEESFLDNLVNFLSLVLDSGSNKLLVFVNLKTFLTKNELSSLYDHLFYTQLPVLLLENVKDSSVFQHERKRVVDQDFLDF